jgi:hypothetical protein
MLIASLTSGQFHGLRLNSRIFNYALVPRPLYAAIPGTTSILPFLISALPVVTTLSSGEVQTSGPPLREF